MTAGIKFGFNPNSSGIGSGTTALLWGALGGVLVFSLVFAIATWKLRSWLHRKNKGHKGEITDDTGN